MSRSARACASPSTSSIPRECLLPRHSLLPQARACWLPRDLSPLLSVQPVVALDAEAVTAQVVMTARRADQAPRRVRLQPPLVLAAIPDAVFRAEHPASTLAVQDRQITHREPERSG